MTADGMMQSQSLGLQDEFLVREANDEGVNNLNGMFSFVVTSKKGIHTYESLMVYRVGYCTTTKILQLHHDSCRDSCQ